MKFTLTGPQCEVHEASSGALAGEPRQKKKWFKRPKLGTSSRFNRGGEGSGGAKKKQRIRPITLRQRRASARTARRKKRQRQ